MKTIYFTASSLDGFIAAPNHSLDWLMQFGAEDPTYHEFIKDVGAIVMGSNTYEWVLRHDTFLDPEKPKPWPYTQPTWIMTSRSLKTVPNADIRFAQGDVRQLYGEIKKEANGKNLWIVGGGHLASQFHDHKLLNELVITYAPVLLGAGSPLFTGTIDKPPLKILSVTQFGKDFVQMRLEVGV